MRKESDDKPLGKTLFVVNIPPYINEPQLRTAFGALGTVENVIICENTVEPKNDESNSRTSQFFGKAPEVTAFKMAYIVFKLTKSLEKALKVSTVKLNEDSLCTGLDKWSKQYTDRLVDEKALQTEVNEFMMAFEEREQEAREESRKTEVDEDGWTVVKKGKAGGGFQQKESVLKALEDKIGKGKERKEFNNFYAFQIRESKQKHLVSLRKRFAQDKLKIEALKKARRFKPF